MLASAHRVHGGDEMREGDDWSVEECLLAIWAYTVMDRHRGDVVKKDLYEEVSRLTGRSLKAVEYKIQNVAACDTGRPYADKPISSASRYQQLLRSLFNEHGKDYRCLDGYHEAAVEMADMGEAIPPVGGSAPSPKYVTEGDPAEFNGIRKSRSSKLRMEARRHYREKEGALSCRVCGVTFDRILPDLGKGREIMQIHHLKAISEHEVETMMLEAALAKVVPVCPTCHVLIHSRRPMLTLDEARTLSKRVREA